MFHMKRFQMAAAAVIFITAIFQLNCATAVTGYDGFWGAAPGHGTALAFKVTRNNIGRLALTMIITCQNLSSGETYPRYFTLAGSHAPDLMLKANGTSKGRFPVEDANRSGRMFWNIRLGTSTGSGRFSVDVRNTSERCDGEYTFRLRRSAHH
jgi:hypothetical protein